MSKSLRAMELARQHDDLFVEVAARYEASIFLVNTGELEQARQHGASMLEVVERLRDRFWLSSAQNVNRRLCSLMGDWPGVREFSSRGLAMAAEDSRNLSLRAILEYQVGDFDQGSVYLERLLEVMHQTPSGTSGPHPAVVIPLIARITGLADRLEVAEAAALTGIPQIKPPFLDIAPAGIPPNIIPHSKGVKCGLMRPDSLKFPAFIGQPLYCQA